MNYQYLICVCSLFVSPGLIRKHFPHQKAVDSKKPLKDELTDGNLEKKIGAWLRGTIKRAKE
jgi:hypothetical protein